MAAIFTRQALYELVWSKPRSLLAKDLGISDVAIAKTCRRAGIPMPPVGWWNKLAAGKKAVRIPLPRRGLGCPDIYFVGGRHYPFARPNTEFATDQPPPPEPEFEESLGEVQARAADLIRRAPLTRDLSATHRLITPLLEKDEERRKAAKGNPWAWDKPVFDTPIARRRLRLADSILKAMGQAQCSVALQDKTASELSVRVGDEWVSVTLQESKGHGKDAATMLALTIPGLARENGMQSEWRDREEQKLEAFLKDICVAILVAGEMAYRRDVMYRYHRNVERRAQRIEEARQAKLKAEREEIERQRKAEQARRDRLMGLLRDLRQAEDIRRLVAAMGAHPDLAPAGGNDPRYTSWREWALGVADRLDPLRQPAERVMGLD